MATTSSNKMPLLVDRPLHSFASLGGSAGLTTASNFNTPNTNLTLIVDCSANDGAIIDSISLISNEASLTSVKVIAFLSVATSSAAVTPLNTLAIGFATVGSSLGDRVNMTLPALCVPVPNLGSPAATMAAYPSETYKKNTGIYVPSGATLFVGRAAITSPSTSSRVNVFAQGASSNESIP